MTITRAVNRELLSLKVTTRGDDDDNENGKTTIA